MPAWGMIQGGGSRFITELRQAPARAAFFGRFYDVSAELLVLSLGR